MVSLHRRDERLRLRWSEPSELEVEELLESDEEPEEELVDRRRLLSPCALHLRRRLGPTSGGGGGSASMLGSVVAPPLEDSLESSDSGVASGTSSRSGSVSLERCR